MKSRRWFAQLLVSAATVAAMGTAALTAGAGPAHAASLPAAAVHCKTNSVQGDLVSQPGGWPILAWFKQTTYWCYNGTSHKTNYTAGVTGTGSVIGYAYKGIVQGSRGAHCYRAAGSHRKCSGNTEYAEGEFQACETNYIYLQSWENYKGKYFHN